MIMETTELKRSFLYDILLPKLEVLYSSVTVLGGILFWNHWGRGYILCIVGLGGLAVVYFLKAFAPSVLLDEVNFPERYFGNEHNSFSTPVNTSFFLDSLAPKTLYISSAVVLIGILFKLMFWKGSKTMLLVGVPSLMFYITALALHQRIYRRAIMVAIIGGLMLSVSEEKLMRQLYRDDPQLVEAIVNQIHHPYYRAASEAYRQRIYKYWHKH